MPDAAILAQKVQALEAQLQQKEALLEQRSQRIQTIEELIKQFQRKQFAPSSEKLSKDQLPLELLNEAEDAERAEAEQLADEETVEVPAYTRRKNRAPASLTPIHAKRYCTTCPRPNACVRMMARPCPGTGEGDQTPAPKVCLPLL